MVDAGAPTAIKLIAELEPAGHKLARLVPDAYMATTRKETQQPPVTRPRRLVSDAEYHARYEREVRRYVRRYEIARARGAMGPGEAFLSLGRWAWIVGDDDEAGRWRQYAREHRVLKAMNPDGSWRVWEPRGAG